MLRARSAQPAPGLPCQGHLLRGEGVLLSSPCSAVPQPSALRRGLCLLQGRAFLYLAQRPCSQWLNQNLFFCMLLLMVVISQGTGLKQT